RVALDQLGRKVAQHQDGVVRGLTPEGIVETAEYFARLCVPRPPQVHRQFGEPFDALGYCGKLRTRHEHAPTSWANFFRSTLPPETTATTFLCPRSPIAGEIAAATAQAAAPSAITRARSAVSFIAAAASSSDTTIDSWTYSRSSGHIVSRTDLPP